MNDRAIKANEVWQRFARQFPTSPLSSAPLRARRLFSRILKPTTTTKKLCKTFFSFSSFLLRFFCFINFAFSRRVLFLTKPTFHYFSSCRSREVCLRRLFFAQKLCRLSHFSVRLPKTITYQSPHKLKALINQPLCALRLQFEIKSLRLCSCLPHKSSRRDCCEKSFSPKKNSSRNVWAEVTISQCWCYFLAFSCLRREKWKFRPREAEKSSARHIHFLFNRSDHVCVRERENVCVPLDYLKHKITWILAILRSILSVSF